MLCLLRVLVIIGNGVTVRGRTGRTPHNLSAVGQGLVFAGVSHFADAASFVQMLPEFVPYRHAVVLGTGVIEILLGIGLLYPRRRREVALALVAYLIAVFPANVYVAMTTVALDDLGGGNPWLRLPFQAVYIAWVLWAVPDTLALLRTHTRRRRRLAGSTRTPATR